MSAKLYLEGGGESKELRSRCREGFRRLFEKAGFEGRMPRLVACGGRTTAFDDFCREYLGAERDFVGMLVDSEEPVPDGEQPWAHLSARDGWQRPPGAGEDQALLMITCMEAWIAADRSALRERFGHDLRVAALPAIAALEGRSRSDLLRALEQATRDCPVRYEKGRVSFEILGKISPAVLATLPGFTRVVRILNDRL